MKNLLHSFRCFNLRVVSEHLKSFEINYVHELLEHPWGQRVVRFHDPDGHIIEIGEMIKAVVERFHQSGMTIEEVAERMDVSVEYVRSIYDTDSSSGQKTS